MTSPFIYVSSVEPTERLTTFTSCWFIGISLRTGLRVFEKSGQIELPLVWHLWAIKYFLIKYAKMQKEG